MRCYFLRGNKIEGVEILQPGPDDELIRQAKELFDRQPLPYESFEVWDGKRFVYRAPRTDGG